MNNRVRGTAAVSVVWIIVMLVLLMAGGGVIWVLHSERANLKANAATARAAADRAQGIAADNLQQLQEVSKAVGYREDVPGSKSNPTQIEERINQLRGSGNYAFLQADATSLQAVLDRFQQEIDGVNQQLLTAQQERDAEVAARAAAESSMRSVEQTKDDAYSKLQDDLTTERDRASAQEADDQQRLSGLQSQVSDVQARSRTAQETADTQRSELEDKIRLHQGEIAELRRKLAVIRYPNNPDGSVVAASATTEVAFIDLGNRNLLRRGTRFEVFRYGKGGTRLPKGMIEVRRVFEDRAECGVLSTVNEYDPIAPGDLISAPNYDPSQQREFVLVGRFPTGYSRALVADRLRALGAKVADKVTETTDFLVIGDKDHSGDPDEDAVDPRDSEDYRTAQAHRIQILPVRQFLEFVRYD